MIELMHKGHLARRQLEQLKGVRRGENAGHAVGQANLARGIGDGTVLQASLVHLIGGFTSGVQRRIAPEALISSGPTSCTLTMRMLGGLGANSFATTTS